MRRTTLVLCLAALLFAVPVSMTVGCRAVRMDTKHSALLDKGAVLVGEAVRRDRAGLLTEAQKSWILEATARAMQYFRNSRDGTVGEIDYNSIHAEFLKLVSDLANPKET